MNLEYGAILVVLLVLVGTAWLARLSDRQPSRRMYFLVAWAFILLGLAGYTLLGGLALLTLPQTAPEIEISQSSLLPRVITALALLGIAVIYLWGFVASPAFRSRVTWFLPTAVSVAPDRTNTSRQWASQVQGFDPNRNVHAFGLGIAQLLVIQTLIDFVLAGGQTGLYPESLDQQAVVGAAALTALLLLVVSFAAVGFLQDRSLSGVLTRLGIAPPLLTELIMGGGMAIVLLSFQFFAGLIWMLVASPEVFEQQTQLSQAIAGSVTTLSGAFLVALFSSIGEEIAYRGALQPVVGLWPASILFALTHIQYQFTPAILIILVVGLAFGWTRRHFGTVAAITAHFCYNSSLLALAIAAGEIAEQLGILITG